MWKVQSKPDKVGVDQKSGETFEPVVTLVDEWGGRAQIFVDDHCFVLSIKQSDGKYRVTSWWFKEAVLALKRLSVGLLDEG